MNLVTKRSLLLTATLITGLISIQSHADVFGGSGQFAMMNYGNPGSVIWILDTETGRVRNCQAIAPSEPPTCTPWSEE
jgi:hypothetical protein|tara:strand:- start:23 stop:256 length:234 start_codon:yes stop_codon:yes gene_type:complete